MLASTGLDAGDVGGPSDSPYLSYIRLGDGDVSTNPPKETDRYLVHGCFRAEINKFLSLKNMDKTMDFLADL